MSNIIKFPTKEIKDEFAAMSWDELRKELYFHQNFMSRAFLHFEINKELFREIMKTDYDQLIEEHKEYVEKS